MVAVEFLAQFDVPPFYQTQGSREAGILGRIMPAKLHTPKYLIKKSKSNINKVEHTIDNIGKYAIKI
jgi:hypothetical protein